MGLFKKEEKIIQPEKLMEKKQIASSILNDMVKEQTKEQESGLYKIVDILLNNDYMRVKTILDDAQKNAMTMMDILGQLYGIKFFDYYRKRYCQYSISGGGGKGRQDIVDITKFNYQDMQQQRNQLLDILRGK